MTDWPDVSRDDRAIGAHARGWQLDRIAPLELNVMRVALYEIEHSDDVPVRIMDRSRGAGKADVARPEVI